MALYSSRFIVSSKFVPEISHLIFAKPKNTAKHIIPRRKYAKSEERMVKSAVVTEINKPLIIETKTESTKLQPGQVRIGVHCCAVNVSDHLLWSGQSEIKPKLPFVPGFEVSGVILETCPKIESHDGSCSEDEEELRVGDRVLALNKEHLHGFSTECVADQKDVFPIPASINFQTAAALADSYGTAMLGIARRARTQQGEMVLITITAGGLGLAAVDIAANVYKTKVIGVCETEEKASLVREKGAWSAFSYKNDKRLKNEVQKTCDGKGATVIFEAAGGDVFKSAMECVEPEGRVIIAGFTSRDIPQLSMADIVQLPSFSLIGVSLFNYRNKMFSVYRRTILDVIENCEQEIITPLISEVFPLEYVNEALNSISKKNSIGKVILEIVDV